MTVQGISFDGSYISLPGAYYADNVAAAAPTTPPVTPPMVVLGYGWGPKPKTPVTFTRTSDFQAAVRGAPISNYIPFIANPSPSLAGAQFITFIDVSRNTQSLAALVTSGAAAYGTLTSTLYGPPSNQLTYQIGSTAGTSGITLTLTDNYAGNQLSGSGLGTPFAVSYAGSASATVSYTASPVVSGIFRLSSPNAGESVTFPIGSGGYQTVGSLVEAINGTGYFTAQGISATQGRLPTNLLDATTGALSSGVSGYGPFVGVPAGQYDVQFWVNNFAAGLATMTTGAAAVSGYAALPVSGTPTFFSGATGVPPVNSDYASGLAVALANPGWTVFCDSNATAVQALLAQHCEIASSAPYGMWRRGFTGSSIGDTVATTITNATDLDSLQMTYAYPGIYRTDPNTGVNQLYGGLYWAAAAAAIAAGNIVAQPLTNQVLNGNGVELANAGAALTQSQLSQLQNGGVMALWTTTQQNGPPTILSDITTWQVDSNVENTSSQQVACRYFLAYSVTNTLRQYVGTIASPTTEVSILNALKKTLNALIYTGGSSNGVLAAAADGVVPWNNLVLTYDGTQQLASVTFNATLVGQNRYVTAFATVEPLNFAIAAAA